MLLSRGNIKETRDEKGGERERERQTERERERQRQTERERERDARGDTITKEVRKYVVIPICRGLFRRLRRVYKRHGISRYGKPK